MCALPCQALTKGGSRDGSPEKSDALEASALREEGGAWGQPRGKQPLGRSLGGAA